MVHPNIFKPRNDWNVITFRCKKTPDSFVHKLTIIIKDETGIDVFAKTRYRGKRYVEARQLFTTFMVRHTKKSYEDIGSMFDKDHATITHSMKVVNNLCDTDMSYKCRYDKIDKQLC